jgi:hypothetical protein
MKTLLLLLSALLMNLAHAQKGLDPVTQISGANLVCGQVNKKFVIFSQSLNRIWYVHPTKEIYKIMKGARVSADLEGMSAFEYQLLDHPPRIPTAQKPSGYLLVQFIFNSYGAKDSTSFYIRSTPSGQVRLFEGEDGTNGICQFLN